MKNILSLTFLLLCSNCFAQFTVPAPIAIAGYDPNLETGESSVYINPRDPYVIVNSNNASINAGEGFQLMFISGDGGQTWTTPSSGSFAGNGWDPTIATDHNGMTYLVYFTKQDILYIESSSDYFDLSDNLVKFPIQSEADKPNLELDDRPIGTGNVELYCGWREEGELTITHSSNQGQDWDTPVDLFAIMCPVPYCTLDYNTGINIAVGPTGEVYATWGVYCNGLSPNEQYIGFAQKPVNGTWTSTYIPNNCTNGYTGIDLNISGIHNLWSYGKESTDNLHSWITMAVNQQNGHIYVVWPNMGVPCAQYDPNFGSYPCNYEDPNSGYPEIYFIESSDDGATWTVPSRVNQNATANPRACWMSCLACDPYTGLLGVLYYGADTTAGPDSTSIYLALSSDEGATWQESPLSTDIFDDTTALPGTLNDYISLKINNSWIVPVWAEGGVTWTVPFNLPLATDTILCNPTPYYEINKATNSVTLSDSSCSYDLPSGSYVNAYSGNYIKMAPGFHAASGSKFHAHIETNPTPFNAQERKQNNTPVAPKPETSFSAYAYPNPFRDLMNIRLTTTKSTPVTIDLYDNMGQLVTCLVKQENVGPGNYLFTFSQNKMQLKAGLYLCVVTSNSEKKLLKIICTN